MGAWKPSSTRQPQTRCNDPTSATELVPQTPEATRTSNQVAYTHHMSNNRTPAHARPLNARILQFCRLYVSNGDQGAAAYRGAGYAQKRAEVGASMLLTKPDVKAQIQRIRDSLHRDGAATRAYVLDRLSYFAEHAKPDSAAIRAAELLGKTERMFVDVTEGPGGASDVPQLRSYTLEELRELRAVMVDGAKAGLEAPVREDVVDVEVTEVDKS